MAGVRSLDMFSHFFSFSSRKRTFAMCQEQTAKMTCDMHHSVQCGMMMFHLLVSINGWLQASVQGAFCHRLSC